jgi:hypothetical protein
MTSAGGGEGFVIHGIFLSGGGGGVLSTVLWPHHLI